MRIRVVPIALSLSLLVLTTPAWSGSVKAPVKKPVASRQSVPVMTLKTTPPAKAVVKAVKPATKPSVVQSPANQSPNPAWVVPVVAVDPVEAKTMVLRTVPLEVSGYPEAKDLPVAVQTPEATVAYLDQTQPLFLHMEALRRAYHAYGADPIAHDALMKALKARYWGQQDNPVAFFDYGYAQLVMDANKNGLFFLRKANDKISNPFTALAYGMAEMDADRLMEKAPQHELTVRKMDAIYKIKDAILMNKTAQMPGIWPTYVSLLKTIKPYSAYESLQHDDLTLLYVPMRIGSAQAEGNTFMAQSSPVTAQMSQASCQFVGKPPVGSTAVYHKNVALLNDGQTFEVDFFKPAVGSQPYFVQIVDPKRQVVGQLDSFKAPYILEDLNGDKQLEVVVRQFEQAPHRPLVVYRWNGRCYCEDEQISKLFQ